MPDLDRYRSMRDFESTPEPKGAAPAPSDTSRFVIQQHDATRLHWDLRLERDGVLASWAMPRGLPWNPKDNHLAVHTEDHPLEYLDFHGDIPTGEYGAGSMTIWDTGTYESDEYTDRKAVIVLHGQRASGRYAMFQTRGRDWIIHRMDPPEDPNRRPLPEHQPIVVAVPGELPTDDEDWAYEIRWGGARALLASSSGVSTISDATGADVSLSFPEVRRIGRALGMTEVILDGVIASPAGNVDEVARHLTLKSDSAVRRRARDHPLAFVAFDLLWLDGYPTTAAPWSERREMLDALALQGPAWQAPAAHRGDGAALLDAARAQGLPGLVAKRADSPYDPKAKPPVWRSIDA